MSSMRARLLWGAGAGVALLFAVTGVLVFAQVRASLEDDFDRTLYDRARALSVLVEQDGAEVETDLEQQLMPEFRSGTTPDYYQLWTGEGAVLARSESLDDHGDLRRDPVALDATRFANVALPDGRAGRQVTYAFHPRREGRAQAPAARVELVVAVSTAGLDATLARLRTILLTAGLIAALLTLGLLLWIVRFGLRPLADVAASIATIDHDDLSVRLDTAAAPTELVPVVERLNELLARVEAAFSRERQLSGDVAHELRTPLTGLRTMMEVALTRDREPQRYREVLAECLAICRSMGRMIESLLALARAEGGHLEVVSRTVVLGPLVETAVTSFAPRIGERGLRMEVEIDGDVAATSDPDKVLMILTNLIDNAVSYADLGGRIRIDVCGHEGRAVVVIANSGCALEASDADRIFERFWRGDAARAIGEHAGLGLPLCRRLAELLDATLDVTIGGGEFAVALSLAGHS